MAVYVDSPVDHGWYLGPSAHLLADTPAELHSFARRIGLKREWVQTSRKGVLHYDLTAARRAKAVAAGAIELDRKGVVEFCRHQRAGTNKNESKE